MACRSILCRRLSRPTFTNPARYLSTNEGGKSKRIGFVGLGNMGNHMAYNLVKHGHQLVVYDISDKAVEKLRDRATSYDSKAEVDIVKHPGQLPSASVDCIITMLPSSPHVVDVYTGDKGILHSSNASALKRYREENNESLLCIDSSTIDPLTASEVASKANAAAVRMVDAPVSGGIGGAEKGTLTFMVGGNEDDFNAAKLYLQCMGKNIVHCGHAGTGQIAKVCNNLALGIEMVAIAEAMNLGVQLGIDAKKLASIFNTSSARCWTSDTYNPVPGVMENVPASKEYNGGFGTALMLKDIGLAIQASQPLGIELHAGKVANELYKRVVESGAGQKDFGYVYQYLKNQTSAANNSLPSY